MRSWSAPRIVKGGGIVLGLVTVVAVALVSLGMIFASPVSAEEPLTINKMRVQVQPEYDESRLRLALLEKVRGSHRGLYITGNSYRGISMNLCCRDAVATAEAVSR